jgi:hypothetical protein
MKRLSQRALAEDDESSWESVRKRCSALDSTRHDAAFDGLPVPVTSSHLSHLEALPSRSTEGSHYNTCMRGNFGLMHSVQQLSSTVPPDYDSSAPWVVQCQNIMKFSSLDLVLVHASCAPRARSRQISRQEDRPQCRTRCPPRSASLRIMPRR